MSEWWFGLIWLLVAVPIFISSGRDTAAMAGLPQLLFLVVWSVFCAVLTIFKAAL